MFSNLLFIHLFLTKKSRVLFKLLLINFCKYYLFNCYNIVTMHYLYMFTCRVKNKLVYHCMNVCRWDRSPWSDCFMTKTDEFTTSVYDFQRRPDEKSTITWTLQHGLIYERFKFRFHKLRFLRRCLLGAIDWGVWLSVYLASVHFPG